MNTRASIRRCITKMGKRNSLQSPNGRPCKIGGCAEVMHMRDYRVSSAACARLIDVRTYVAHRSDGCAPPSKLVWSTLFQRTIA